MKFKPGDLIKNSWEAGIILECDTSVWWKKSYKILWFKRFYDTDINTPSIEVCGLAPIEEHYKKILS